MTKQEEIVVEAARRVLNNWLGSSLDADISGDFGQLELAFRAYDGDQHSVEKKIDWSAFRREAAKDILCAVLAGGIANGAKGFDAQKEELVNVSIGMADELIKQLREEKK